MTTPESLPTPAVMLAQAQPFAVGFTDDLEHALGAPRADRWRIDRSNYRPIVWTVEGARGPVAAALTSGRPATAATKIVDLWWDDGADAAASMLLDAVIVDAQARGDAAVKWEVPRGEALPGFAHDHGFSAMRAPYPSAAGTEGVEGWVRWLVEVPHAETEYYAQTTLFTCGAVAALLAVGARGDAGFSGSHDRDLELSFWRQASNFPACEPVGLAVALRERLGDGAPIRVALDTVAPVLLEGFDGFERSFRVELQEESRRRAEVLGVPIADERASVAQIRDRVMADELALLLIDEAPMHGEAGPHWVLGHAGSGDLVIIEDPWISAEFGETWVDTHDLPIPLSDLDDLVAWGPNRTRGVVFLARV